MPSKRRTEKHVIDEEGQRILRKVIPSKWVLRDYKPDYGIDYDLEIFETIDANNKNLETLGEHVFIQLKSHKKVKTRKIKVYQRLNIEKYPEKKLKEFEEINVIPCSIETSELVTVQRMGALPVLLVVADISTENCYFVCLNDYIDKVLIPKYGYYTKKSHTIYIPMLNILNGNEFVLRWYAKRPKLYAAFVKFYYQQVELSYSYELIQMAKDNTPDEYNRYYKSFIELARHFAKILLNYDFWYDRELCKTWRIIRVYARALYNVLNEGRPGLLRRDPDFKQYLKELDNLILFTDEELDRIEIMFDIMSFWKNLSGLSRTYEEVCREWFLPTSLGIISTYT